MRRGHSQFGESHRPAPADGPGPFLLLVGSGQEAVGRRLACLAFHVASCGVDVAPRRLGEGDPRSLRTHTWSSQGPDCLPWTRHWEPQFTLTLGSQARGLCGSLWAPESPPSF